VDLLNRLNNFVFRAGLFGENFLRLTPMDAPDRARRGKPPRRLCCGARDRPEPVIARSNEAIQLSLLPHESWIASLRSQ